MTGIALLTALVACAESSGPAAADDLGLDAGAITFDAEPGWVDGDPAADMLDASELSCPQRVPTEGFGTYAGRAFADFTLQTCDGSDHSFYDEAFCEADLTVVTLVAGWCAPAISQSSELEREINAYYAGRGVRVIEILVSTADYDAPDLEDCSDWASRFGLSNRVLIDPAQLTGRYFPDHRLPATIVVDEQGSIRFRTTGYYGMEPLRAAIDELLAE